MNDAREVVVLMFTGSSFHNLGAALLFEYFLCGTENNSYLPNGAAVLHPVLK